MIWRWLVPDLIAPTLWDNVVLAIECYRLSLQGFQLHLTKFQQSLVVLAARFVESDGRIH